MLLFRPWYQQSLPGRWVGYWDLYRREMQEGFSLFFFISPYTAFESPLGTPNVQLLLKHTLQSQSRTASSAIYGFDHSDGLLLRAVMLPPTCQESSFWEAVRVLKTSGKPTFLLSENMPARRLGMPWRCFGRQKPSCHQHTV